MAVQLTLLVGPVVPIPAPIDLTQALSSVSVSQSESGTTCQLTFNSSKVLMGLDWGMVNHPLLLQFNRVIVVVTVNFMPRVLFDGFITNRELNVGSDSAKVTVTCEDVKVKMDLVEVPMTYPMFLDFLEVLAILAKYAVLGVVPMVIPPLTDDIDLKQNKQQIKTDLSRLKELAGYAGYVFYVLPGPLPGLSVAYWGPRHRLYLPQPRLSANLGPATNVESMTASHNAQAPQITWGTELVYKVPVPYTSVPFSGMPPFSFEPLLLSVFSPLGLAPEAFPAVLPILPIKVKHLEKAGKDILESLGYAQGKSNLATEKTVKLSGSLNAARYGFTLGAPGVVGVRGMGFGYDGFYYVESVQHSISHDHGSVDYTQSFSLSREGMYTTTPIV
ncbi:MAG: hypothetical protein GY719_14345 [bacterium]|nr:hypothetical protein [bacterium]